MCGNFHVINLTSIRARVDHPDKKISTLQADQGIFDTKAQYLQLNGRITGVMSDDMTLHLKSAKVDMKGKTIESDEPVRVEMLNGSVISDTMYVDTNARELFFKGGVKVEIKSLQRHVKRKTTAPDKSDTKAGKGEGHEN